METQTIYIIVFTVIAVAGISFVLLLFKQRQQRLERESVERIAERQRIEKEDADKKEAEENKLLNELKNGSCFKKLDQMFVCDAVVYLDELIKLVRRDTALKIKDELILKMEDALKEKGHTGYLVLKSCFPQSCCVIDGTLDGKEISVHSDCNGNIGSQYLNTEEATEVFYFYSGVAIDLRYDVGLMDVSNHNSVYDKAMVMADEQIEEEEFAESFKQAVEKLSCLKKQQEEQAKEEQRVLKEQRIQKEEAQRKEKLEAYL